MCWAEKCFVCLILTCICASLDFLLTKGIILFSHSASLQQHSCCEPLFQKWEEYKHAIRIIFILKSEKRIFYCSLNGTDETIKNNMKKNYLQISQNKFNTPPHAFLKKKNHRRNSDCPENRWQKIYMVGNKISIYQRSKINVFYYFIYVKIIGCNWVL